MTSTVGDNHLPESISGPCGCFRYHELNTHKITKMRVTEEGETLIKSSDNSFDELVTPQLNILGPKHERRRRSPARKQPG